MQGEPEILGYFDWDGDPCRLLAAPDSDMRAEIYRSGSGFVATSLAGVTTEGVPIGKSEFQMLVEETIRLRRAKP